MRARRLSLLALAAGLAGCSTLHVETQYSAGAPFASYRSYAWLSTAPGAEQAAAIRNPAVRSVVVSAVDRELAAKGLARVIPDQNPDLFVAVIGTAQGRVEVAAYGYGYAGPYVGPVPVATVSQYADGTLLVDLVDAKTRKLVWRGIASDTFTGGEDVRAKVEDAVRHVLAGYPPGSAKP
jgi:hypothetical protein